MRVYLQCTKCGNVNEKTLLESGVVESNLRNVVIVHNFDDELVDAVEVGRTEGIIRATLPRDHRFINIFVVEVLVEDTVDVRILKTYCIQRLMTSCVVVSNLQLGIQKRREQRS